MLFGNSPMKPKGLLGMFAPGQSAIPMPQGADMQASGHEYAPSAIPQARKPGFFAEGGIGRQIAGVLGDALLQQSGGQPIYLPNLMQQRAFQQRQQMMQEQRQNDWGDWQKQAQWKIDHEKPPVNDTVADFNFFKSLDPEGRAIWDQMHPIVIDGPDGRYMVPRSSISGMSAPVGGGSHDIPPGYNIRGGASGNAGSGFPVRADYSAFKHAIIGQESGGRYGVPNAEGSGAMGVGQVMPDTGRVLAQRAGLPWRPDLMAGTGPDAQAYQDKITEGAAREAWAYGKGNPQLAAYYYFAGPDKGKWGPKTRQYGVDILRRIGRGGN